MGKIALQPSSARMKYKPGGANVKYGVLVVGAGSAGAILASRLFGKSQRSVLLLEAGPDYPDFFPMMSSLVTSEIFP